MTLIADVFPKLRTPRNVVGKRLEKLSKKTTFGGPFNKQHVKRFQTVLTSEPQCLYQIYRLLCTELTRKKFLLVIWKILTLFVTTLRAEEKYSLLNKDNLMQPIHMQLSQEQKIFF